MVEHISAPLWYGHPTRALKAPFPQRKEGLSLSTPTTALEVKPVAAAADKETAFRDAINKNARWVAEQLNGTLSPENICSVIHELALRGWEHNDSLGGWPATDEDHEFPLRRLPDKIFGHMVGESLAAGLAILGGHANVHLNVHSAADLSFGVECKTARQQRDSVYALNNLLGQEPVLFIGIPRGIQAGSVEPLLYAPIPMGKVEEMKSLSNREQGLTNLRLRDHSATGAAGIAAEHYTKDAEDVVEFLRGFKS
jgi:hypothetical protein